MSITADSTSSLSKIGILSVLESNKIVYGRLIWQSQN